MEEIIKLYLERYLTDSISMPTFSKYQIELIGYSRNVLPMYWIYKNHKDMPKVHSARDDNNKKKN